MSSQVGLRGTVEVSLDQGEWLDHASERADMGYAELIHEAIIRLQAGPSERLRPGGVNFPDGERAFRLLTMHLKGARWADDEAERIGIHRAELVRQAIERLQMNLQRGGE